MSINNNINNIVMRSAAEQQHSDSVNRQLLVPQPIHSSSSTSTTITTNSCCSNVESYSNSCCSSPSYYSHDNDNNNPSTIVLHVVGGGTIHDDYHSHSSSLSRDNHYPMINSTQSPTNDCVAVIHPRSNSINNNNSNNNTTTTTTTTTTTACTVGYNQQHINHNKKRSRHCVQLSSANELENNVQKRKICSSNNIIEQPITATTTPKYRPMEDSTLAFLVDLVCQVVEKKTTTTNLSPNSNTYSQSSNNSNCSIQSPITTENQSVNNYSPTLSNTTTTTTTITTTNVNNHSKTSKRPFRTAISIKELLN